MATTKLYVKGVQSSSLFPVRIRRYKMNNKGLPCPVRERQGRYLLCQEGECSICQIELDRPALKQIDDKNSMNDAL